MSTKAKIAFICYLLVAISNTLGGLVYVNSTEIMPYHLAALGVQWTELNERYQVTLLTMVRSGAFGGLTYAAAVWILLIFPFRKGDKYSRWAIPILGILWYVPHLYISKNLANKTGADAPWPIFLIAIIIILIGFILSLDYAKNRIPNQ